MTWVKKKREKVSETGGAREKEKQLNIFRVMER